MNNRSLLENRKAIAYRRNTYKREWLGFENALQQLGLNADIRPLSAEDSLAIETRIREETSVPSSTSMVESQKVGLVIDLEKSLDHFLSVVSEHPLVVWLLNSNGLLFEATGLISRDIRAFIQYDGDTVVVCRRDLVSWLVLDDNDDEIEGRFFELTIRIG